MVVKTGIPGLDSLFADGGLPEEGSVLLIGGPGTGKTIFGMQFLYEGATRYGESGIYVSLLEHPEKVRKAMSRFGWDLETLGNEGKLTLIDAVSHRVKKTEITADQAKRGLDMASLTKMLAETVRATHAKRVVVDAISALAIREADIFEQRTEMLRLSIGLADLGVTSIVISEAKSATYGSTEFPIEAFLFDGIIRLNLDSDAQKRKLAIRKCRSGKHAIGSYNFDLTDSGIRIVS